MKTYEEKKSQLLSFIDKTMHQDTVVAFSGGVDSSLLLYLCCVAGKKYNTKVYGVMICSVLSPSRDYDIARAVAAEAGAVFDTIHMDELSVPQIRENALERCYVCKKYLFTGLLDFAAQKGITTVLEGTNEDDLHVYRPGIRAIKELGIQSPLVDAGLSKEQVRRMASEYGISVAQRPSSPCLATRFPYGTHLNIEDLKAVEKGEQILRNYGFHNVRLRVHKNIARIEVDGSDMPEALRLRREISQKIRALGYDYVTLDLEGFRSGSMDVGIGD